MNHEKKLFLLDAYALIYRSYYAFINNPMFNQKGLNTSTIFGFTMTIEEILRKQNPTHISVAFDPPGPTFRDNIFPAYKANRPSTPEDIKSSVPYIKRLLDALNISTFEIPGYEADDVIGTIAKIAEKQGFTVYMMTPDKDYGQLVSPNIFMYKPRKSGVEAEIIGVDEILKKYQIKRPDQVKDILALWGDASDNVPGAPGIGEKTALKLINEYDNIENLIEQAVNMKTSVKDKILNNIDQIKLSKFLVTIKTDLPIDFDEDSVKKKLYNNEKLKLLFNDLNFKNITSKFIKSEVQNKVGENYIQGDLFSTQTQRKSETEELLYDTIDSIPHDYKVFSTESDIKLLVELINKQKEICFDTETTGLDVYKDFIVGISLSFNKNNAFYVPIDKNFEEAKIKLNLFLPFFNNNLILKIGHNLKFDILMLRRYDIKVKGPLYDTMIAHYLLQPEISHKLDDLSLFYLNYKPVQIIDLIGKKGKFQKNMRDVELTVISEYAGEDADVTFQLKSILDSELNKNNLNHLFNEIEMPLLDVLVDIEVKGVKIDINALNKYALEIRDQIIKLEKDIFSLAGNEFNISSPKQLGDVLFERLKITEDVKVTKTQQYSTDEETLSKLINNHPIIEKILTFKLLKKLLSTYVEALPLLVDTTTNRIHTSFNQTVTSTGRLSSNNPNLQNIPIRDERGREIRKSFIPENSENIIVSADYSQIELRIMAHLSEDNNMIEAFIQGEDIHASTASKIYNIPISDITKEQRRNAKTANFGIIYGISGYGLSQRLNISKKEANDLIEGYFKLYPGVKDYMDRVISSAQKNGYVETIFSRKRFLPDIGSKNSIVRGMSERNAINAPIQGSAADIIKIAMIKINNEFKDKNLLSAMILQVHDELVFDVLSEEAELVKKIVKKEMEQAVKLKVPLIVDLGAGMNWLEAH